MVRPLILVLALAGVAHASALPSRIGMYPAQGAPLAMLDAKIAVTVRGPIVEAVVTQRFRNDSDRVTEATYIFPLPADAAVSAMAIAIGARTIHAAVEKRAEAQRRYEQAVAAGLGAGLLDHERPDVFTQTVSAIPAHGVVEVTLRFDATATYASDGTWELALPLVVAPRYVPGSASGRPTTGTGRAPDTDRAPDASRVTPGGAPGAGGAVDVTLELADAADDVHSPTHELRGERGHYAFTDPHADHDAIVRWHAKAPAQGWVERGDDGAYAAVVVTAPPPAAARKTPVRCLFVIDRAATTRGDADATLRPLVRALLGTLDARDAAAATGSTRVDWRAPDQLQRALDDAWTRPGGAFDLTAALAGTTASGAAIVLVSDGLVADDRAAIAAAKKLAAPIYVVAIGPAPNRSLLAAIAAQTGGTIRFASAGDDLTALARAVIADAAAPPKRLAVTWGELAATDVVPATLPRVGAGQSVLVVARVNRARPTNARVGGDVFVLGATATTPRIAGAITARGPLARRWARMKLDELLADPAAATAHALRHGLVSPYTSMVAIGDDVIVQGGVKHTVAVPVSVPAGMRWQEVRHEVTVDTTGSSEDDEHATREKAKAPRPEPAKPAKKERGKDDEAKRTKKKSTDALPAKRPPTHRGGAGDADGRVTERKPKPPRPASTTPQPQAPPPPPQPGAGSAGGSVTPAPVDVAARPGASDEADRGEDSAQPMSKHVSSDRFGETISLQSTSYRRRSLRISAGLALGYASVRGAPESGATGGLDARFEVGGRNLAGLDASVWLVGGLHLRGELLATFARTNLFTRWLELGAGFGFRLGDGFGPALGVSLRVVPPRLRGHFAVFGRYDGGLRFHDNTYDGENAATGGIEWRW